MIKFYELMLKTAIAVLFKNLFVNEQVINQKSVQTTRTELIKKNNSNNMKNQRLNVKMKDEGLLWISIVRSIRIRPFGSLVSHLSALIRISVENNNFS